MRLVLTGPLAGKTVLLRGLQYVNGVAEVEGTKDYQEKVARYHAINWQARPEEELGECEIQQIAQPGEAASVPGGVQQDVGRAAAKSAVSWRRPGDLIQGGTWVCAEGRAIYKRRQEEITLAIEELIKRKAYRDWTLRGYPKRQRLEVLLCCKLDTHEVEEAWENYVRRRNNVSQDSQAT